MLYDINNTSINLDTYRGYVLNSYNHNKSQKQ